ncbi:response regulator [Kitasatospora sp. NPDC085879]|uniref:response regulator n=1 Tax=Kitasatospora sp. NPDC085879 TaxID=3154769 RepID=UPI003415D064
MHIRTHSPQHPPTVLVVDDDEDVQHITRIALRTLSHEGRPVELLSARSATEALQLMREHPDIGVVLLDVVMESDHAGLDTCRAIRDQLGNTFVRILLRTGQPGRAPEETVVEAYGVDGYLPKAELTSTRLITVVRTALKAYDELVRLEARRRGLETAHESVREMDSDSTWAEFRVESP